jgi:enterochelin esterase family protein
MKRLLLAVCTMLGVVGAAVVVALFVGAGAGAPSPAWLGSNTVAHGAVAARSYQSNATGTTRRLHVYTPPGYDGGTARFPVLYLLHGAGDDDTTWIESGHANDILDHLIADRKAAPMVVVMPLGYAYRRNAGVPNVKQRADFEKDLIGDVVPFIEANYRVFTDRDHRALGGLSMGGGQALTIGLNHLDLFSRIAAFSAGGNRNPPGAMFAAALADPKRVNGSLELLWLGCGTDDDLFEPNQELSELFNAHGIVHTFRPSPGGHAWATWQKDLAEVAPQLWPVSPDAPATDR